MAKSETKKSTGSSASPGAAGTRSSSLPKSETFPCLAYGPGPLAPMVPMRLKGPNGATITEAGLVDSGADTSAFPLWMMRPFGIRKRDCKKESFDAAGGTAKQWIYPEPLEALIMSRRVKLEAVFCDTPVPLLGRCDFFRRFRVTFLQPGNS